MAVVWLVLSVICISMQTQSNKKTAKQFSPLTAKILSATATRGISAFNFRWFQQPIRSCGIVLTANQHCGQSLTIETTNLWDYIRYIFQIFKTELLICFFVEGKCRIAKGLIDGCVCNSLCRLLQRTTGEIFQ